MYKFLKLVALTVITVIYAVPAQSCDVCGCATNANYFGILPQFRQHFAGIRYMSNSFTSKATPSLFEIRDPAYRETLQRTEVWGRFYPADRIQLFAFIPYQYNTRRQGKTFTESYGLSDISVMANYIILNSGDSGWMALRNTLSAGAGIKAPTGRFDPSNAAAMQTGSGSWDYMLNAIYTVRYNQFGLNTDVNYRINSAYRDYQYGNRFTSSVRLFWWQKLKRASMLPHAGILLEHAAKDSKYNHAQKYTGGGGCYAAAGLDIYLRKFSIGFIYTLPLNEQLNAGYTSTSHRASVQLLYLFN